MRPVRLLSVLLVATAATQATAVPPPPATFAGRHGIYLEDLFVRPAFRGNGIGKALIVELARRCVDENLPRLQWQVLDWNKPSIEFYEALGAKMMPEWIGCRLEGDAIAALAG